MPKRKWRQVKETLIKYFFGINGIISILVLLGIFLFLAKTGLQSFEKISFSQFFLEKEWNPTSYSNPQWGILAMLIGTIYIALGSLVIAIPIGIATALYLSEIASPIMRELLKPAIEMIAAVPSVVLGLFGLIFLVPLISTFFKISSGLNALSASILVAIMVLPTIISISEDIIREVPQEYKEASLALGATQWETIQKVILPVSASGIFASIMLGLGRAIGETMLVLIIAGNAQAFPKSFLDPVRPITANIAIEIKEVVTGDLHYQALFATGLLLFMITFAINLVSDIIIHKQLKKLKS